MAAASHFKLLNVYIFPTISSFSTPPPPVSVFSKLINGAILRENLHYRSMKCENINVVFFCEEGKQTERVLYIYIYMKFSLFKKKIIRTDLRQESNGFFKMSEKIAPFSRNEIFIVRFKNKKIATGGGDKYKEKNVSFSVFLFFKIRNKF